MNDFAIVTIREHPELGLQLIDWRKPAGETDTILRPPGSTKPIDLGFLGDVHCYEMQGFIAKNPQAMAAGVKQWTEAVKVSRVTNVAAAFGDVTGGTEDVVDITDSHDLLLDFARAEPTGRFVSTVKGGSSDVDLRFHFIFGRGTETDHDLGNWYDYNGRRSKRITIFAKHSDLQPSRVRQLHSDRPTLVARDPEDIFQAGPIAHYDLNDRWTHVAYPAMWVGKKLGLI